MHCYFCDVIEQLVSNVMWCRRGGRFFFVMSHFIDANDISLWARKSFARVFRACRQIKDWFFFRVLMRLRFLASARSEAFDCVPLLAILHLGEELFVRLCSLALYSSKPTDSHASCAGDCVGKKGQLSIPLTTKTVCRVFSWQLNLIPQRKLEF